MRTSYEDLETVCGTWFETTNAPLNATAKTSQIYNHHVCPKGQALLPLAVLNSPALHGLTKPNCAWRDRASEKNTSAERGIDSAGPAQRRREQKSTP